MVRGWLVVGFVALVAVGLVAGCGGSDDSGSSGSTGGEPLAMEERVVPGDLGGVPANGSPTVAATTTEFVEATDSDTPEEDEQELVDGGFKSGVIQIYGNESEGSGGFGLSGSVELGSPEQASAYAATLAEDFAGDDNATQGTLDGVPGSTTWSGSGEEDGVMFEFASAVFTDGSFVYAMFAGGPQDQVDADKLLEQAQELYEFVNGRPSP